ncbi:hypothetical protein BAUCODRAFT_72539 [Baudoinia panamericana UAMH 10762]|uniref:NmrA-like domain-containing protein n=1 Tax=Baudoinia panamericana (strain UAMH 10762) TaxID=717646 RepID=M2N8K7_BAUPA|nr:uncharacterized protein BAUCODRAFT_72539 [Baudoinia panamericana UAMH 10762]EMC95429.1 hypothetical protein BAUCODRAFT_72539 [Baudoinia panamericana UAMH 10762]
MASQRKQIFIIGGTGAQGVPVVEALTRDQAYSVRILTRNLESPRAQKLAQLPHVELVKGSLDKDEDLRKGFHGCWGAFVNLDGFVIGQKNELFWGIRSYQLAQEAGVKFFVWGNLDYVSRDGNYDPQFRTGHYDIKGIVGDWILSQTKWHAERAQTFPSRERTSMGAALFTTGPYLDMVLASHTIMTPTIASDGVVEWRVPLHDGAVAHIALEDCGKYVRWQFDNAYTSDGKPGRASGLDLAVATEHVRYTDLAAAFSKVTGKSARCIDMDEDEYWDLYPELRGYKFGKDYAGMRDDDGSLLTWQTNFAGFWHMWQHSGGEDPLIKRDYKLLDEILPDRVKSVEEWFTKHKDLCMAVAEGKLEPVLKLHEDRQLVRDKQVKANGPSSEYPLHE